MPNNLQESVCVKKAQIVLMKVFVELIRIQVIKLHMQKAYQSTEMALSRLHISK